MVKDTINNGHRLRLKKRFLSAGRDSLSDHEFLELILHFSIPRKDTKSLAKELLTHFGSINNVLSATTEDLINFNGIGESSAILLHLFYQTHIKLHEVELKNNVTISGPEDLIPLLKSMLSNEKKEFFASIFMGSSNNIITKKITQGTVDQAAVYPREIAEKALLNKASRVIIAHNHPTGNIIPSNADKQITQKIKSSLQLLDIDLLDHIIIGKGNDKHYSFQEHGIL
ncbi:MAG: hypothetical protein COA79_05765 [Planctomycetota bacterium]|nr:MAG: hypothetical protein COA79_05765 [Planctomycetota bacterium]